MPLADPPPDPRPLTPRREEGQRPLAAVTASATALMASAI